MTRRINQMSLKDLFSTNLNDLSTKKKFKKYSSETLMGQLPNILPNQCSIGDSQYNSQNIMFDSQGEAPSIYSQNPSTSDNSSSLRFNSLVTPGNIMITPSSKFYFPQQNNTHRFKQRDYDDLEHMKTLQPLVHLSSEMFKLLNSMQDKLNTDITDNEQIMIKFTKMQSDVSELLSRMSDILKELQTSHQKPLEINPTEELKSAFKEVLKEEERRMLQQIKDAIEEQCVQSHKAILQKLELQAESCIKSEELVRFEEDMRLHIESFKQSVICSMESNLNAELSKSMKRTEEMIQNLNHHISSCIASQTDLFYCKIGQNSSQLENRLINYIDAALINSTNHMSSKQGDEDQQMLQLKIGSQKLSQPDYNPRKDNIDNVPDICSFLEEVIDSQNSSMFMKPPCDDVISQQVNSKGKKILIEQNVFHQSENIDNMFQREQTKQQQTELYGGRDTYIINLLDDDDDDDVLFVNAYDFRGKELCSKNNPSLFTPANKKSKKVDDVMNSSQDSMSVLFPYLN